VPRHIGYERRDGGLTMPIRTTVQLNLTVPAEVAHDIRRNAKRAGLTISDYVAARIRDDASTTTLPAVTTDARVGYVIVSAIAASYRSRRRRTKHAEGSEVRPVKPLQTTART
jgi:hypothetical protein